MSIWQQSLSIGLTLCFGAFTSVFAEELKPQPVISADGTISARLRDETPKQMYSPGVRSGRAVNPYGPVNSRVRYTRGGSSSVQVNVDENGDNIPGDAANEPSIAIDPNDFNHVAIGWRQFDTVESNFRQAGRGYSQDGGLSWTFPGVLQPGEFASDPVLDSDSMGRMYYYSLQPDRGPGQWACYMYRSLDGGVTFENGRYAFGGDKAWFNIDKTDGSSDGNLYIVWSPNAGCCSPFLFTRSFDAGLTYSSPSLVTANPFAGTITTDKNGSVYIVGGANEFGNLQLARSISARNPLVPPTFEFSRQVHIGGFTAIGGVNPQGLLGQMWVATDNSEGPESGNIYVCGSVSSLDGSDPIDVKFTRSIDGGANFTAPVRINDDPVGNGAWQWFGTMSVAPNGRIDVVWNDTRNDATAFSSELYYSFSHDGGVTWRRNIPLSIPFVQSLGYPNQAKLGDYYHMISDNLGASLAYAATFNGEQDVYFLRLNPLLEPCIASENVTAGISLDCNRNGIADYCDLDRETSLDVNENFIPDECEFDFDADGLYDLVDPDLDNDGVVNSLDECDFSALGAPIQPEGNTIADADHDCHVGLLDFRLLQACLVTSGPDLEPPFRFCVDNFDHDTDEDIDLADVAFLQRLFDKEGL
ncbi:MAG: sialidase family protein [Planctomycetota bacterium]